MLGRTCSSIYVYSFVIIITADGNLPSVKTNMIEKADKLQKAGKQKLNSDKITLNVYP